MIKDGQQRRFETEATEDEKYNSVDVGTAASVPSPGVGVDASSVAQSESESD
jgi:hypothetical protein